VLVLTATPSMLAQGVSAGAIIGVITYITGSMRVALYTASQGVGNGLVRLYVTYDRIRSTGGAVRVPRQRDAGGIRPGPAGVPAGGTSSGPLSISLRDVRFSYGPHAAPVIDGLSLTIPAGDHLAIAGPSGIGKSSLAGLIAGTLVPDRGEIRFGGVPVGRLGREWRVLIPQEAYVFAGTVEENLAYYRQDGKRPGKAEMDAAAEETGLVPLLSRLGGYGAEVSPAALSAGQRQLIALTRAYLSPAPVAILDEATCYLDPAAERQAEEAFARRGGILIVIAHRITAARRARRILVLDGVQARVGDHDDLMAVSSMYRDLAGYWSAIR
jgi:ATP-binding cassette subfamily C protein